MPKIRRIGGLTDATARGFVSPADELRARGKLGPYDVEFVLEDPVEPEPEPAPEPEPEPAPEPAPVTPAKRAAKRAPTPKVPDDEE